MSDLFDEPDGATSLDMDEMEGLRLPWVETRTDLNEAETANIGKGLAWANRPRRTNILTEEFARTLHRKMFGEVWAWAGNFRTTEKNIGVDPATIGEELHKLFGDTAYWVEHKTYAPDEIAMRFHRRLTWIHPFPNGNGRHARLMADLLARKLNRKPFSWGSGRIHNDTKTRDAYLRTLRTADQVGGDFEPLIKFARS